MNDESIKNMNDESIKSLIISKLLILDKFIRDIEDFADSNYIDLRNNSIYIASISQRTVLRALLRGATKL